MRRFFLPIWGGVLLTLIFLAGHRPTLTMRAFPAVAIAPKYVMFTAELVGGDDLEEFYCLEDDWYVNEELLSKQESDCDPWVEGTQIQRRWTKRLCLGQGRYEVEIRLSKAGRLKAKHQIVMEVHPGAGDVCQ